MHQLPGCRSAAEAVREARRTEALRSGILDASLSMTTGLGMRDVAGFPGFWMFALSRGADIKKSAFVNPNSRFTMPYALVSGRLSNLWVMLSTFGKHTEGKPLFSHHFEAHQINMY